MTARKAGAMTGPQLPTPGDLGMENEPAVVFADNFEGQDFRRWNNAEPPRPPKFQTVAEKTRVHGGQQSVQFQVAPGKGVGTGLVKWFQSGYDRLYAHWYCLFADDCDQGNLHHAGAKFAAQINLIWMDDADVVVATKYIGPVKP